MVVRKRKKGSYTVEAAIILPVVLFAIFEGMAWGIELCREVQSDGEYSQELEDLRGIEIFRKVSGVEEWLGERE